MNHVEQLAARWNNTHDYTTWALASVSLRAAIAADKAEAEKAESVAAKMTQHHTSKPLNERTQFNPPVESSGFNPALTQERISDSLPVIHEEPGAWICPPCSLVIAPDCVQFTRGVAECPRCGKEITQGRPRLVEQPAVWQCPVCRHRFSWPGSCPNCEAIGLDECDKHGTGPTLEYRPL